MLVVWRRRRRRGQPVPRGASYEGALVILRGALIAVGVGTPAVSSSHALDVRLEECRIPVTNEQRLDLGITSNPLYYIRLNKYRGPTTVA